MKLLAGVSQINARINIDMRKLLIPIPSLTRVFNSATNDPKYAFRSLGLLDPDQTATTIGAIYLNSVLENRIF